MSGEIRTGIAKRTLTIEKVKKIYEQEGIEMDTENAEEILEFVYFLAKLIVQQNLGDESSRSIRKSKY